MICPLSGKTFKTHVLPTIDITRSSMMVFNITPPLLHVARHSIIKYDNVTIIHTLWLLQNISGGQLNDDGNPLHESVSQYVCTAGYLQNYFFILWLLWPKQLNSDGDVNFLMRHRVNIRIWKGNSSPCSHLIFKWCNFLFTSVSLLHWLLWC